MGNAYFQLVIDEGGTWIRLIPETGGGEPLDVGELMEYLNLRHIAYDADGLRDASCGFALEKKWKLCDEKKKIERESYKFSVEENGRKAVVRFYAPAEGGALLERRELLDDLRGRGIRAVDEEAVDSFFGERRYCTSYVVARGREPKESVPSTVQYFFNTDPKARPTLNEDGSVDFFHLNTFNRCKAGDILARTVPGDPGTPGEDVFGNPLPVREVKPVKLRHGRNITLRVEEDGSEAIYSEVAGHVSLVGGDVFVSDVLEVENVDTSTGNIDYDGSVQVNGNVCSNFSVRARGNVEVRGVVEGATVEAGGNIVIVRGMNGMGKGVLKAGRNVVAKYLEGATVEASGDITCNSIMQSTIMCRGGVAVDGRKGFIAGGKVCAAKHVTAKTLGSQMGVDTIVEVGTDPKVKERFQSLNKKMNEAEKVIRSLDPILKSFEEKVKSGIKLKEEEVKYLESLIQLRKMKKLQSDSAQVELGPVKEEMKGKKDAFVLVSGKVYHGTKVSISNVSTIVHDTLSACKFVYQQGDVKAIGI